jgi:hypothetical protein
VSPDGLTPTRDFNSSVPSLDNGQMFWGAYAVAHLLEESYSHILHRPLRKDQTSNPFYLDPTTTLAQRWTHIWKRMVENALIVFYDDRTNTTIGELRTVTVILDRTLPINHSLSPAESALNYVNAPGETYLNDPYEGELFTNMAYLLSDWDWTGIDPSAVWIYKREMLQAVDLMVPDPSNPGQTVPLTVERGNWYSGHEKWKYWMMPYDASSWSWRVFLSGEKARTAWSVMQALPGGFASAAGMADSDSQDTGYVSACGIQQLAWVEVTNTDILTPYAFAALHMASPPHGLVWYHNILLADRAQTCFGSIEALNRTGTDYAPLGTWDTKITSLVALAGGIGNIIQPYLEATPISQERAQACGAGMGGDATKLAQVQNALQMFTWAVDTEWSRVFANMTGEDLDFYLPTVQMPQKGLGPFPSCNAQTPECLCDAAKEGQDSGRVEAIALE